MSEEFLIRIECDKKGLWSVIFPYGECEEGLDKEKIIKILDFVDAFIKGIEEIIE